jgi:hypothetical protein
MGKHAVTCVDCGHVWGAYEDYCDCAYINPTKNINYN